MLTGAAAGLWRYSLNNQLLIIAQAAARGISPPQVAGCQAWRSRGRQVRAGEKGLSILAPAGSFLVDLDETKHACQGRIVELPDGERNGMALELTREHGERVAGVFEGDETGARTFTVFGEQRVPVAAIEWLLSEARTRLWDPYGARHRPITGAPTAYCRRLSVGGSRSYSFRAQM
jgi:hypothetical protein